MTVPWKGRHLAGCILMLVCAVPELAAAQDGAVGPGSGELVRLVDNPTAGLVDKGRFAVDMRMFPDGGLVGQLHAGIMRRLTIGLSYGGEGVIGNDPINWYPRVEAAARYRVLEESEALPAFAIGYETQGYGPRAGDRYQVKSKGFFVAASKNYVSGFGQFGVHTGINWSRESQDDDGPNGWVGIDKTINEELSAVAEYDFALNDNADDSLGSGRGYLNAGTHWSPVQGLRLGFLLKNILENGDESGTVGGPDPDMSRELSVRYTEMF
ncbi:MAG TPA: hypothetical protein QGF95_04705 [Candidatus Latescibacteria bacterium]|nr:hypothetical protein [Gemmatimonadaceae bacterium]MDP6016852.1 hypothetical protein [Candidatus Latescibacterota bacterium]HJP29835.1 hypothetical protein [Candidatus Latescibacterota bacterium]